MMIFFSTSRKIDPIQRKNGRQEFILHCNNRDFSDLPNYDSFRDKNLEIFLNNKNTLKILKSNGLVCFFMGFSIIYLTKLDENGSRKHEKEVKLLDLNKKPASLLKPSDIMEVFKKILLFFVWKYLKNRFFPNKTQEV